MRKRVILALMLVVALAATTSCSLIVKDAEVDKQTVIIEVAGKTFTKGEVLAQITQTLDYQEYIYQMYGMAFDKTAATAISDAQDTVIEGLIQQAVIDQKKTEMDMNTFADEETAEMQKAAEAGHQGNIDSIKTGYFTDTTLTGEELDKAISDKMNELGYPTVEQLLENEKATKGTANLKADVTKDVAVSGDEVKTKYDELVQAAMDKYASDLGAYGTDVQNGAAVYYVPAGYRYVKNLLIKISEDDSTAISGLNKQISDKQIALTATEASLAELGEDASADDEAKAADRKTLTETKAAMTTEMADLQTQLDAAKEAAYASIDSDVQTVLDRLESGDDFDALLAELGQDEGMKVAPTMDTGYLVCEKSTNWVTEFMQGAMALKAVGDVSPAVRTSFGVHSLKYQSDLAEGAVALDTVKDTVKTDLLTEKQNTLYESTVQQWVTDANAKVHKERLAN